VNYWVQRGGITAGVLRLTRSSLQFEVGLLPLKSTLNCFYEYMSNWRRQIQQPLAQSFPSQACTLHHGGCLAAELKQSSVRDMSASIQPLTSTLNCFYEYISNWRRQIQQPLAQSFPSLAARYLEKKTCRYFDFFATPPSCFPGLTRG